MQVTVLGSGTSVGVPVVGCQCKICTSSDPKNSRTRASILLTDDKGRTLVVDTSPEFRLQMVREKVASVEHVLFTHTHSDHTNGFDDLRGFYFSNKIPIKIYMVESEIEDFKNRFAYIFKQTGYMGSRADISIEVIPDVGKFKVLDFDIETARLPHGNATTTCFKFGTFLYATDFKTFPDELIARWKDKIDFMIASGPKFGPLPTHSSVLETAEVMKKLGVKRGCISHLSHEVDYVLDQPKLPEGIEFAYDGLKITW